MKTKTIPSIEAKDNPNCPSFRLDRDLVIADVGCRWGFSDNFTSNVEQIRVFGFDPDEEECERIQNELPNKKITLVPKALYSNEGIKTLHITQEPACSSLYKPNEYLTSNYPSLACAKKVEEKQVNVTTLDNWMKDMGVYPSMDAKTL